MNDQWDVFHGQLNSGLARVYVRCRAGDCQWIRGHVRGPFTIGQTIPHSVELKSCGDGLYEALVFDPVSWAPGHGTWYQVTWETQSADQVSTQQMQLGLKHLGVREAELMWEAQPYQLRGRLMNADAARDWSGWLESGEVPFFDHLSAEELQTATEMGVPVGLSLSDITDGFALLSDAAAWPATCFVLSANLRGGEPLKQRYPNLIFIQDIRNGETALDWVDAVACEAGSEAGLPRMTLV